MFYGTDKKSGCFSQNNWTSKFDRLIYKIVFIREIIPSLNTKLSPNSSPETQLYSILPLGIGPIRTENNLSFVELPCLFSFLVFTFDLVLTWRNFETLANILRRAFKYSMNFNKVLPLFTEYKYHIRENKRKLKLKLTENHDQ